MQACESIGKDLTKEPHPIPCESMAIILPATATVQLAATGRNASVASLPAGAEIVHQGQRMRVLAVSRRSGKAMVEPSNQPKEAL